MTDFAAIFIGACLINNLVLDHLLGVYPGMAARGKVEPAWGISIAMSFALTSAALVTYPIQHYLLTPLNLAYLQLFCFVFVITLAILLGEVALKKISPARHEKIAPFIPLTLVNSAALGVALLNLQHTHGLTGSLVFGLGSGAGFAIVTMMMAAMQQRLEAAAIPQPFRGVSILLITFGIISMAFMGFIGMVHL